MLMTLASCKAQSPVIDLFGSQSYGTVDGAYYKDVNGFLNQYIGTWLYTNGTTSLKIVFQKREQKYVGGAPPVFYEDMLVGEYQYIENGVEKVNTLNQINVDFGQSSVALTHLHHLWGNVDIWYPEGKPKCSECAPNEKRLLIHLNDPNFAGVENLSNDFVLRKYDENNIEKLKVWFYPTSAMQPVDENGNPVNFTGFSLPFGEYVLIKQP